MKQVTNIAETDIQLSHRKIKAGETIELNEYAMQANSWIENFPELVITEVEEENGNIESESASEERGEDSDGSGGDDDNDKESVRKGKSSGK